MGYHSAGFEVVGVDINPQPHYPFEFHQADAMTYPLDGFDAIHASPPCQSYSVTTNFRPENRTKYPDLVAPTRDRLVGAGRPYVIENVPGSPLLAYVQICGSGMGMSVRRHRWFECSFAAWGVPCAHGLRAWDAALKHSTGRKRRRVVVIGEYRVPFAMQCEAMGVDWMDLHELSEAIPPAYTEWIGAHLLEHVALPRG
jgi:DNA (cytosine-5)-methyltransferase 1